MKQHRGSQDEEPEAERAQAVWDIARLLALWRDNWMLDRERYLSGEDNGQQ